MPNPWEKYSKKPWEKYGGTAQAETPVQQPSSFMEKRFPSVDATSKLISGGVSKMGSNPISGAMDIGVGGAGLIPAMGLDAIGNIPYVGQFAKQGIEGIGSIASNLFWNIPKKMIEQNLGSYGISDKTFGLDNPSQKTKDINESANRLGQMVAPMVAAPFLRKGVNIAGQAASDIIKRSPLNNNALLSRNNSPSGIAKANAVAGEIAQGKINDIPKIKQAVANIDVKNVKSFKDLHNTLNAKIEDLSSTLDEALAAKEKNVSGFGVTVNSMSKKLDNLNLESKVGEQSIQHNFVKDALSQLNDFYTKTNDVEGLAKIKQITQKATDEGLTPKELNDIARLHGQDLNGYNANGELASGLTKQAAENTRIGLKETARKEFGNDLYVKADKEISNLIRTRELVDKLNERANALRQSTKDMGWGERAGKLAFKVADIISGGTLKGVLHQIIPYGSSRISPLELEKGLNKRLQTLQNLTSGNIPENVAIRQMQDFIRLSGGSPNDYMAIPNEVKRNVVVNNYPVNPKAKSSPYSKYEEEAKNLNVKYVGMQYNRGYPSMPTFFDNVSNSNFTISAQDKTLANAVARVRKANSVPRMTREEINAKYPR